MAYTPRADSDRDDDNDDSMILLVTIVQGCTKWGSQTLRIQGLTIGGSQQDLSNGDWVTD